MQYNNEENACVNCKSQCCLNDGQEWVLKMLPSNMMNVIRGPKRETKKVVVYKI